MNFAISAIRQLVHMSSVHLRLARTTIVNFATHQLVRTTPVFFAIQQLARMIW